MRFLSSPGNPVTFTHPDFVPCLSLRSNHNFGSQFREWAIPFILVVILGEPTSLECFPRYQWHPVLLVHGQPAMFHPPIGRFLLCLFALPDVFFGFSLLILIPLPCGLLQAYAYSSQKIEFKSPSLPSAFFVFLWIVTSYWLGRVVSSSILQRIAILSSDREENFVINTQ
jgi:hypothetical protein